MKEINEIKEYLQNELYNLNSIGKEFERLELEKQLNNAYKVGAKLQGAIDLFKEIEGL